MQKKPFPAMKKCNFRFNVPKPGKIFLPLAFSELTPGTKGVMFCVWKERQAEVGGG
jgi:hypothetical protein